MGDSESNSTNMDVVASLKAHEDRLSKKVEDYRNNSTAERDTILKKAAQRVEKEKEKLAEDKEEELEETREKANKDAKEVIKDYEKQMKKLDVQYSKNSTKAVNAVVSDLFEEK